MTWPLTYDDGINLRAKSCNEQSHYICMKYFSSKTLRKVKNNQTVAQIPFVNVQLEVGEGEAQWDKQIF